MLKSEKAAEAGKCHSRLLLQSLTLRTVDSLSDNELGGVAVLSGGAP